MDTFVNFPSINQFYDAIQEVKQRAGYAGKDIEGKPVYEAVEKLPVLHYVGYPKLHGTCCAIVFTELPGASYFIHYQSRERILTPEKDNYDFASSIAKYESVMGSLFRIVTTSHTKPKNVAVFGEWVGDRVSGSVCAIDSLSRRFVVFAVKIDEEWQDIRLFDFSELSAPIFNVSAYGYYEVDIDFNNPNAAREYIEAKTNEVEAMCPVAQAMGVEGPGEGVVWHCKDHGWDSSRFWFKVKGHKHKETSVKQLTEVELQALKSAEEFANATVTEERLQHALQWLRNEASLPMHQTSIGSFVQRVVGDVLKEEDARLKASGLVKRDITKPVGNIAKAWFIAKLKELAFS